jgi:hypothetical protein
LTVEVTFVGLGAVREVDPSAEGVVRMPDGSLRPFCGWIDLLAALERVTSSTSLEEER